MQARSWLMIGSLALLSACDGGSNVNHHPDGGGGGGGDGGGSGGGTTVTGTVQGGFFHAADAVSSAETGAGSASSGAIIFLSDDPDLCDQVTTNAPHAHEGLVAIILQISDGAGSTTAPTGPGTFTVGATTGMVAAVEDARLDTTCMAGSGASAAAMSGSVELTAVAGDVFTGSVTATFANGDTLNGEFHPTACPAIGGSGSGSGTLDCQP